MWERSVDPRFIPTCVGNSMTPSGAGRIPTVHPHMRGELRSPVNSMVQVTGSSPHAWGTHGNRRALRRARRFIPTCVGNSGSRPRHAPSTPVHPHMRGELGIRRFETAINTGSSPHAWGTRVSGCQVLLQTRFIPTCVGNSSSHRRGSSSDTVHPHMRGELIPEDVDAFSVSGSSPHAWGTRFNLYLLILRRRFIPTCVGNSVVRQPKKVWITVHPHMRGELSLSFLMATSVRGSSPHAWGTPSRGMNANDTHRFIPTCVGNSRTHWKRRWRFTVHPHMRGELVCHELPSESVTGSSPHAWGTRFHIVHTHADTRFIPTCVGNS